MAGRESTAGSVPGGSATTPAPTQTGRQVVAVSIDAGDTPGGARALSLRGRAGLEIVDGVVEEYLAAARISMVPTRPPGSSRPSAPCTTGWRASRFYDFGAGRVPRFLQELAERSSS